MSNKIGPLSANKKIVQESAFYKLFFGKPEIVLVNVDIWFKLANWIITINLILTLILLILYYTYPKIDQNNIWISCIKLCITLATGYVAYKQIKLAVSKVIPTKEVFYNVKNRDGTINRKSIFIVNPDILPLHKELTLHFDN